MLDADNGTYAIDQLVEEAAELGVPVRVTRRRWLTEIFEKGIARKMVGQLVLAGLKTFEMLVRSTFSQGLEFRWV